MPQFRPWISLLLHQDKRFWCEVDQRHFDLLPALGQAKCAVCGTVVDLSQEETLACGLELIQAGEHCIRTARLSLAKSMLTVPVEQPTAETPRFHQDCPACVFLGPFGEADLYFCDWRIYGSPTVIARFSDAPTDYIRGMDSDSHRLVEAKRRAVARGLLDPITSEEVPHV